MIANGTVLIIQLTHFVGFFFFLECVCDSRKFLFLYLT